MYYYYYIYLYIWKFLGLDPYIIKNDNLSLSYSWLVYSLIFHSCLIIGQIRILLRKYYQGVTGKYITGTQLTLRLAEQLFAMIVIILYVINKFIKFKEFALLQKELNILERHYRFPINYQSTYVYPLFVTIIYLIFLLSRLVFDCTSNNTWDTFIPQLFSSIIIITCEYQWFLLLIHFNYILKHLNARYKYALVKQPEEMRLKLKLKIVITYFWRIHDIIQKINIYFGVQILGLLTYRAARLVASCYALVVFTFQIELYPFALDQFVFEVIWLILRVNQLVILVYPCDKIVEEIVAAITTYLIIALDFQSTDVKMKHVLLLHLRS